MIKSGTPCTFEKQSITIAKRLRLIDDAIAESGSQVILDIGCGVGVYEQALSARELKILGIDLDRDSLVRCQNSCTADLCVGCSENLPFKDNYFDMAFAIEVLEHVDDVDTTISEAHRVLKRNGVFLLTAPNRGFPFLTHGFHIGKRYFNSFIGIPLPLATYLPKPLLRKIWSARCFSNAELCNLLKDLGFQIDEVCYLMPAFDHIGISSRFPSKMRSIVQKMTQAFDYRESSWMGFSICVRARKI